MAVNRILGIPTLQALVLASALIVSRWATCLGEDLSYDVLVDVSCSVSLQQSSWWMSDICDFASGIDVYDAALIRVGFIDGASSSYQRPRHRWKWDVCRQCQRKEELVQTVRAQSLADTVAARWTAAWCDACPTQCPPTDGRSPGAPCGGTGCNTCLLDALASLLKDRRLATTEIRIYSDMIEDCRASGISRAEIEGGGRAAVEDAVEYLAAIGLTVPVTCAAPILITWPPHDGDNAETTGAKRAEVEAFWRAVFVQVGIANESIQFVEVEEKH